MLKVFVKCFEGLKKKETVYLLNFYWVLPYIMVVREKEAICNIRVINNRLYFIFSFNLMLGVSIMSYMTVTIVTYYVTYVMVT